MDNFAPFEEVGRLLLAQRWIYAKTMPHNPHHYTLRKEWRCDDDFVRVVEYIREHGYKAYYKGRPYMQLDVNEHFYWTMGAPIPQTILINRKVREACAPYDAIAPHYDALWCDAAARQENEELAAALRDLYGDWQYDAAVLDVGCGTGLLLDLAQPRDYTGVDPSPAMLERLRARHSRYASSVVCAPLRSFVGKRYDLIVALFGAASYLTPEEQSRIPSLLHPGGRFFLMYYHPDYAPLTHERTRVHVPTYHLADLPGQVTRFGNFLVVEGGA